MSRIEDLFYQKLLRPILYKSTLGKTSIEGLADTGFNFDYMYRNEPSGDGAIGKLIDKVLLSLPAVQATRNRKETIKQILKAEITQNINRNKKTNILDIACGTARYLVELAAEMKHGFHALCLDCDERSMAEGKKLLEANNAAGLIEYKKADIFNKDELGSLHFNPGFIIASGLYVYHDDASAKKSIEMLAGLLPIGGKILVDNQIKNPSRKLMEKVCKTTRGESWALVYRTEEQMSNLLSPYFQNLTFTTDKWGMYNIGVGTKI
jgi:SAM-dependent methyltransferase